MDQFQQFRQHFDQQPLNKMLGITLVERRPGFARICLNKDAETPTGIGGSVHGGILAAMRIASVPKGVPSMPSGDE